MLVERGATPTPITPIPNRRASSSLASVTAPVGNTTDTYSAQYRRRYAWASTRPNPETWLQYRRKLHVKPQKWAGMATDGGRAAPCARRDTPDPVEAAIRFAIRKIRYSPPKGTVKIVEISTILDLRTNPTGAGLVRYAVRKCPEG